MPYLILRGHCYHIIILLYVHAPTEDKTDDAKGSFYEGLEHVYDKFTKYHTNILLGDFYATIDRVDIFKLTGNESLHKINNDNGVRTVNFPIYKNSPVKSTMFLHHKTNKLHALSPRANYTD
jgi:hypothetical protein